MDPLRASPGAASEPAGARAAGACGAPGAALYLRPDGLVTSCCSGWHVLGRIGGPQGRTLREVWDGAERAILRRALDAGDFELGCFECGRLAAAGRREDSLAHHFDRYVRPAPRRYPAMMDFALSNRCNLRCVQCNGNFSSSIRHHRERRAPLPAVYDDRFLSDLDEFLPHLERAQFKGGEPFLSRENRHIWDRFLVQHEVPEICVTTNGTIWNVQVERYVTELACDLIISVDAIEDAVLQRIRVGVDPRRFWSNVDRFRAATQATGGSLTLSFCLMSLSWHQLTGFLARADQLGAQPDVIWVDGPGAVNLLTMPGPELTAALRGLEGQATLADELSPASRAIWDDALARVRARLDDVTDAPSVVAIDAPARRPDDSVRAVVAQMRAEHGREPLVVGYVNDVVTSVEPHSWSTWLEPSSWVGHGLDETMMVIASDAGSTMRSRVDSLEGGAHRVELTFADLDPARRLHCVHVPDPSGEGRSHLVLVESGRDQGPG